MKHKGTVRYIRNGYVMVKIDGVWLAEHRVIWEREHGPLIAGWHVHHVNGDRADNRPENLQALKHGDHSREHKKFKEWPRCTFTGCGREAHKRGYCDSHYTTIFRREKRNAYARKRYRESDKHKINARNWYRRKHGLPLTD